MFFPQDTLRDAGLHHIGREALVISEQQEYAGGIALLHAQEEVHQQHGGAEFAQRVAEIGVNGVAEQHQCDRSTVQTRQHAVHAEDFQQVVDVAVQIPDDDGCDG